MAARGRERSCSTLPTLISFRRWRRCWPGLCNAVGSGSCGTIAAPALTVDAQGACADQRRVLRRSPPRPRSCPGAPLARRPESIALAAGESLASKPSEGSVAPGWSRHPRVQHARQLDLRTATKPVSAVAKRPGRSTRRTDLPTDQNRPPALELDRHGRAAGRLIVLATDQLAIGPAAGAMVPANARDAAAPAHQLRGGHARTVRGGQRLHAAPRNARRRGLIRQRRATSILDRSCLPAVWPWLPGVRSVSPCT